MSKKVLDIGLAIRRMVDMKTTGNSKALAALISSRYGVTALECDALVVEWAAHILAETVGNVEAGAQWKKLNAQRERVGRHASYPAYASPLFATYFGKPERDMDKRAA